MSYGSFNIAGLQEGTPSGGQQSLGPFAVAFGPVTDTQQFTVNTTVTVPIPADCLGVWVIPPIGTGAVSLTMKTVNGDTGERIARDSPSYLAFDPTAVPSNLYLVSGSSVVVTVQFV